jgi:hypothetical protein
MPAGTEDLLSQSEKLDVLRNDQAVREQREQQQRQREQSGTYLSHTHPDEISGGGRYAAVSPTSIVGSGPAVKYPPASSSWQIQLPDEPPLSAHENPALEPSADSLSAVEATGGAPSSLPPDDGVVAPPSSPSNDGSADA